MKRSPAEQCLIEPCSKHACCLVVHRPAGGDDTSHATLDQRMGHAGGKLRAIVVGRLEQRFGSSVARWQQLTNTSSGMTRSALISCVPRNEPPERTTPRGSVRFPIVVGGSPWPATWMMRHGCCMTALITAIASGSASPALGPLITEVTRALASVGDREVGTVRQVRNLRGLPPRAHKSGIQRSIAGRIANNENAVVGRGALDGDGGNCGPQLAQQLRANGPWLVTVGRCRRLKHLPGNRGRLVIELEHRVRAAAQERFEIDRYKQVEQRASDLCIGVGVVGGGHHKVANEPHLHGLRTHVAARTFGIDGVDDLMEFSFGLRDEGTDKVVVGATVSGFRGPTQRADALLRWSARWCKGPEPTPRAPAAQSTLRSRGRDRVR